MGIVCGTRAPPAEDPLPLLRKNLEISKVKIRQYERLVREQLTKAQSLGRTNRKAAAYKELRTKKQYDGQLTKYRKIEGTLSANILAIQESNTTQEMYDNLKLASVGLRAITSMVKSPEDIHAMTDELDGIMTDADAFQTAMGEGVESDQIDEDEFEDELNALLKESMPLLPADLPSSSVLDDPVAAADRVSEKKELRRLTKAMAFA